MQTEIKGELEKYPSLHNSKSHGQPLIQKNSNKPKQMQNYHVFDVKQGKLKTEVVFWN